MELSNEQKALLETEFSAEIEKQAAEEAALAFDLYAVGFDKMASEAADEADKEEKEEEEEKEDKKELSEEQEKAASERAAFMARGYVDGLLKQGSERHDYPLHYIEEIILEKIAKSKGSQVADLGKKLKGMYSDAGKAIKGHNKTMKKDFSSGAGKMKAALTGKSAPAKGGKAKALDGSKRMDLAMEGAKSLGKGALKASPYAVGLAGAGYGAKKALSDD